MNYLFFGFLNYWWVQSIIVFVENIFHFNLEDVQGCNILSFYIVDVAVEMWVKY